MDSALELRQSVLQDVISLFDNDEAMRKLQKYLHCLKNGTKEEEAIAREREKQEILEDIREAMKELRAAREGKIKLQNAREFLNEIRH